MKNHISLSDKIWSIKNSNEREVLMISQKFNINELLAKLITLRNIDANKVYNYLNPNIAENLPNPFYLKDMKKSVERTYKAIINNEKIAIIADYDVDGSSSAAILYKFLKIVFKKPIIEVPDRLNDGYGPNNKIMNKLISNKVNLLFTLDCGTTSFDIFNNTKLKNIDTIIIDHHISEEKFPNVYSIINPNRFDEDSSYENLAAVGVTYLFLIALRKFLREKKFFEKNQIKEPNLLQFLDLVALGTVCDVVKLVDYNRVFVAKGLQIIHKRENQTIRSIIDNSKLNTTPNISDISFIIGPQLNAASRISDSSLPSKILISEDINEIDSISRKLFILNEKRKLIENQIFEEALSQIDSHNNNNFILVKGKAWHKGVLGIIASRLVEKYNKPAIVLSSDNKISVGSARSINNLDLGTVILNSKRAGLLISGGGHKMAAGIKIQNNMINDFEIFLSKQFKNFEENIFKKINYFDSFITCDDLNLKLIEDLEKMEPFGNGNQEPVFIITDTLIDFSKIIKNNHVIINISDNFKRTIKGICFNCANSILGENLIKHNSRKFDIVCTLKRDYYDIENVQMIILDAILRN